MKLKRFLVPLLFATGILLDSFFFARVNLFGIHPDILMALIVSYGVLMGGLPASILGGLLGLFMDVMFNKCIGLCAIAYMVGGYVGGLFFQKFYADNVIIPALAAALCQFCAEHLFALGMLFFGGTFRYLVVLPTYILPSAVLTGLVCIPAYLLLRYALEQQTRLRGSEMHG